MKIRESREIDLQTFSFYRNKKLNCSFAPEPITRSSKSEASSKKKDKPSKHSN